MKTNFEGSESDLLTDIYKNHDDSDDGDNCNDKDVYLICEDY
jgi:hypothetical protein